MLRKALLIILVLSLFPSVSFGSAALQAQQQKQQAVQAQMIQQRQAMMMQRQQQLQFQYQQAMIQVQQQAIAQQTAIAQASSTQLISSPTSQPTSSTQTTQVEDVSTLEDIWRMLETSSLAWSLIVDQEPKVIIVQRQIEIFRQSGVIISKSATHYAGMIDAIAQDNPGLLVKPFRDVLRFVAVVEYDFHNGTDSDTHARQLLGDDAYLANRQRLGL